LPELPEKDKEHAPTSPHLKNHKRQIRTRGLQELLETSRRGVKRFRLPPTIRDRCDTRRKKKGKKNHSNDLLLYRQQRHATINIFMLREKVNMDKYAKMWLLLTVFTLIFEIPLTLFAMTNFPHAPPLNTWRGEEVAILMLFILPLSFWLATIPTLLIFVALRIKRNAQTTRT